MNNIRVGIVGLGRLGKVHAQNLATGVSGCELTAACSLVETELAFAQKKLGVKHTFSSYEEMVKSSVIDAVFIVSPSGFHCDQVRLAMENGKHVFTEKPLGLEVEDIKKTQKVIEEHPEQVFMLGFMRRYDESYQYAKKMVEDGEIGEITLIRCYGIDPSEGLESFVKFAMNNDSGGLFLDMAIHDIDLVRWFTGQEVDQVWAIGKNAAYPELDQAGELETGAAMMSLSDKTMALLVAGRNAAHGYHVETEIMGTKGMLRVAQAPEKNLVTIMNDQGIIRPCSQNFPERFREAFIREAQEFISCIQEKRQPAVNAEDGLQSTKIALACQESFDTKSLVQLKK
ncbi:inositol 2-dehydrogenase [Enterococcus hulanensis]|uniref:inositol 2-dehydrogenase n=1 Tax=Enterococcus TaxID=1350 RepID=UPI000B5AA89C|nr:MULTISPECIES: inositol 2-dehydrogenase [Enterococcus]MBO0412088.1 inositol 2-dehydrogenase [Enterococcus hulanensis]MBO0455878.1 inositol 2-dehydrogenase [Enterococcus hulanensis]MBX8937981.1 inositol 2-dehydrogenase [Enterococcus gilvus]MDT2660760.1 inositol 2-dehydrogenase [Enterococcus hulanensis]OTO20264.1 myo-inositol 2-dehydrogenase [Enterococcus sp. 3H8_DIV0648]